jgi:hypothetical protein
MWSALALAAALSLVPGQNANQTGQLKLTNDRLTYGILGPPRADTKFLPGDQCVLRFDIEGLPVDKRGHVLYGMGMEFTTADGKTKFKQVEEPREQEAVNSLGGSRVPAFAYSDIGTDVEPGEYNLKVTVTDRASKQSQTVSRKITVAPKAFGLVRPQLGYPSSPWVAAPNIAAVGQTLMASMGAAGFERDKTSKQPNLLFELRVLDENGKPVVAVPDTMTVDNKVEEGRSVVEWPFFLHLNRPGKFTIEMKATDQLAKKSSSRTLPLTVVDPK